METNQKPSRRQQQAARRLMKERPELKYTQALRIVREGEN